MPGIPLIKQTSAGVDISLESPGSFIRTVNIQTGRRGEATSKNPKDPAG